MRAEASRQAPLWAAVVTFVVVTGVVAGVLRLRADPSPGDAAARPAAESSGLSVQVVQLRRDEVLGRVELAVLNGGEADVVVDRLRLTADGFTGGGWVPRKSPVPAGQVVNLPTPYGDPRCPSQGTARLGGVSVDLRVHSAADPASRTVTVTPTRSRALLTRVLRSLCLAQRLSREVTLSLGDVWRPEGSGADIRLHTTLDALLTSGTPPRDLTQVAGSVIYDLAAETPATPYARLDAAHPTASVPVVIRAARCTAHAKGETKQPYRFLVWLGAPGTEGQAVELPVRVSDQVHLRAVCAL
jgi:hypothetical protein